MLDVLVPEQFARLVGQRFAVRSTATDTAAAGPDLGLELVSVDRLRPHSRRAAPFSVSLRGPHEPLLPQGTYPLEHASLGRLELFLVPIRREAAGVVYEAIFN